MEETLKLILEKITSIDTRIGSLEKGQQILEANQEKLSRDIVTFENKVDDKLTALFDGYKQTSDSINEMKDNINRLTTNQERQDVEIKVIHTKVQ